MSVGSSCFSQRSRWAAASLLLAVLFALPQTARAVEGGKTATPPAAASTSSPLALVTSPAVVTQPVSASTDDLKNLLTTLQDPSARQKLIGQIQSLIELRQKTGDQKAGGQTTSQATGIPAPQPATIPAGTDAAGAPGVEAIQATSSQIRRISDVLVSGAAALLDIPRLMHWIEEQLGNQTTRLVWLYVALKIAGVLAAAFAAEQLTRFLLRGTRRASADRESAAQWVRLLLIAARLGVELIQIAVFGAVAYILLPLTSPDDFTRAAVLAFVNANVIVRALLAGARAALAPDGTAPRILPMSAETAGYWFVWLWRLIGLAVYGSAFAAVALLVGLPLPVYDILLKALGFCLAALLVVLIFQNRAVLAKWLRGDQQAPKQRGPAGLGLLRARLADVWHILASLYVVGIYGVWAAQIPGGFDFIARASIVSVLVVVAVRMLVGTGDGLLRRFFSIGDELKQRFPGLESRADRYLPILVTVLHVALYAIAALILAEAWGLGAFSWLRTDWGRQVVGDLATIAITVVVAVAIWEGVSLGMEYYFFRPSAEGRQRFRQRRVRTLVPLIRRSVAIVLIIFVVLIGLSELGVNIAPLLAGAGVVGIAIGFGAQNFVKDLINGMNLLLEDTIGVGDTVTIGADTGTIEAISMRTLRLRDGVGALHTIPFSDVTRVTNSSRDFGRAVFDIPVAFSEDYDRMVDILQKTAAELKADPNLGLLIMGPPTQPVLDRFTDNAMIIHMEIKTP
ncbi:MAG TPA: mechanosensitive ion channel domain-containing protein, partial [Dongiaceae bacterium]